MVQQHRIHFIKGQFMKSWSEVNNNGLKRLAKASKHMRAKIFFWNWLSCHLQLICQVSYFCARLCDSLCVISCTMQLHLENYGSGYWLGGIKPFQQCVTTVITFSDIVERSQLKRSWSCLRQSAYAGFTDAMKLFSASASTRNFYGHTDVPSMKFSRPLPQIAGKTWAFHIM